MTANQKKSGQQGFTIIEMIVVLALSAVLLIGLLGVFDWQTKVYNLEQADVFATGSARNSMNNIITFMSQGVNIVTSRTINGTSYTTGGSTVVLQLPAYDSSDNLIVNTYDYVVFTASGTNLEQVVENGANSARPLTNKRLSDKLETFALTYNNGTPSAASQVTVDLTTKAYYRSNSKFVSTHLTETIFLRNK